MHSATQIADWIVRFRAEAAAPVDPMSLQKLLFYAQAFHLARHGDALFADKFKAWVDGVQTYQKPMVRSFSSILRSKTAFAIRLPSSAA